jgi:PAS domain-containing protein
MCDLLGRPAGEIVGRQVVDFFTADELATIRREIAARLQGAKGHDEIGIVCPDRTRRDCVNHATPLRDSTGRTGGSVGLWTDITERRCAELALRRYEMVTNSLTDTVSVIDGDENYRMVTPSSSTSPTASAPSGPGWARVTRPTVPTAPRASFSRA